jgi:peptidoglycan hydrolase-like protein with peptidoglycan-binding domain
VNDGTDYTTTDDDPGSDSTVVAVQKALAREGYYHGPIDGTLDLITQDAIARYDRNHRLPVSHGISRQLLNSLGLG